MTDVLKVELHWRPRSAGIEYRCVCAANTVSAQTLPDSEITRKYVIETIFSPKVTKSGSEGELLRGVIDDVRKILRDMSMQWGVSWELLFIRDEGRSEAPDCEGDSFGELHEDGLDISWGGNCPIQGDGTLDGQLCYYRSRGSGWSFDVWPPGVQMQSFGMDLPDEPEQWSYEERCYVWPEGGWISAKETIKNLRKALAAWRAHLKEMQS